MSFAQLPRVPISSSKPLKVGVPAGFISSYELLEYVMGIRQESGFEAGTRAGEGSRIDDHGGDGVPTWSEWVECADLVRQACIDGKLEAYVPDAGGLAEMSRLTRTDLEAIDPDWLARDLRDGEVLRWFSEQPAYWAHGKPILFSAKNAQGWLTSLRSPQRGEVKAPRRTPTTKDDSERRYRERVQDWPSHRPPPSRREDEEWCRDELGLPRDRARELRRHIAPDWQRRGRRSS